MKTLLAKYLDGYEGRAKENGEEPVKRLMLKKFAATAEHTKQWINARKTKNEKRKTQNKKPFCARNH